MLRFWILNKNWHKLSYLYRFRYQRRKNTQSSKTECVIIPLKEVRRFIQECMEKIGAPEAHAEAVALCLSTADYRGHYGQGLNRIEYYINDIKSKLCDPKARPKILKERETTAWVDGNNALGVVVGNFCMKLAIAKAKCLGIGWVACKGSNHFGISSLYTNEALKQGLIGIVFTNSSPYIAPTRGKLPSLGVNPIAVAAPADGVTFDLDMATSTVTFDKIERKLHEGKNLPEGWAIGPTGAPETDPEVAFGSGYLTPLGRDEINSGYKGYGLALVVEILCGILGGASFGRNIRKWGIDCKVANLGHSFIAVDLCGFDPKFKTRLTEYLKLMKSTRPADPEKPVITPGDPERVHMKEVDWNGGVKYVGYQIDTYNRVAKELDVKPPQGKNG